VKIGLFGGTFNPVHNAHLIIAAWIADALGLDCLYLMPTAQPPHRPDDAAIIDIRHRVAMVRLAIQDNPAFRVVDYESDPAVTTYSIDTVRRFLQQNPDARGSLYFIIGEDNFRLLATWKEAVELSRLCRITVASRGASSGENIPEGLVPPLFIGTPRIDISATMVRERLLSGKPVRYLIPEPVEAYIREHNLYADA